jgi:beta-glucosidase/6-phospho-beta-glucosidase/beta-galactosidase
MVNETSVSAPKEDSEQQSVRTVTPNTSPEVKVRRQWNDEIYQTGLRELYRRFIDTYSKVQA